MSHTFDNALGAVRFYMEQLVYRALWKANRVNFADKFVSVMGKMIETLPLAKPLDQVVRYEAELAEAMH